ncbi:MAG: hypothetical protein CMI06_11480 [Oceanospirillaceae bacterium]|nr:hypothetical protein [Oceanospirillaceae bacterium]|tara:strand:- start:1617 stop:3431 length:1815 start_codon:yes stop_codon:yes gene_type:complete
MLNSASTTQAQVSRLFQRLDGRQLKRSLLKKTKKTYAFGWEIKTNLLHEGEPVYLQALFTKNAKFELPDIFVRCKKPIEPLRIPHVEAEGKLCVWSERAKVNFSQPDDYVTAILSDAYTLLSDGLSGMLDDEFRDEFQSYWQYEATSSTNVVSLVAPISKGVKIAYTFKQSKDRYLLAESRSALIHHLKVHNLLPGDNRKVAQARALAMVSPVVVIGFEKHWLPSEYPRTFLQLLELIQAEHTAEWQKICVKIIRAMSEHKSRMPLVVCSFNNCMVAFNLTGNLAPAGIEHSLMSGFSKRVSLDAIINRLKPKKILPLYVIRSDFSWVNGRDHNQQLDLIKSIGQIVIIGCGSIGSGIARHLVQSGVRKLLLIDGDYLMPENISRHELGFESIQLDKVSALAAQLQKKFPESTIETHSKKWQSLGGNPDFIRQLKNSELIVSCTGEYESDMALLELRTALDLPDIMFCWTEPNAVVSHAFIHNGDSPCFSKLFNHSGNEVGNSRIPATLWNESTLRATPACAGEFQPYGYIDVSYIHSIAAERIINLILNPENISDRWICWQGDEFRLKSLGGGWNESWQKISSATSEGCKKVVIDLSAAEGLL